MDELHRLMAEEHMFIDPGATEVQDLTRAVKAVLRRLISRFNSQNNRFFIKDMIPGGSMVEQTRIWENQPYPMIEFDFLVLLQYRHEAQHVAYGCPGHLKLLNFSFSRSDSGWFSMNEEKFQPDLVGQEFSEAVIKAIKNNCEICKTPDLRDNSQHPTACSSCLPLTEDTPSGYLHLIDYDENSKGFLKPLRMKWYSKRQTLIKPWYSKDITITHTKENEITILADFVPGFAFSRTRIPEMFNCNFPKFPKHAQIPQRFFLVPKLCAKQHKTCWRISYCTSEVQTMRNTYQKHRDAYKMIKIFKNYALENTILSTYYMKSVVLRHIDICTDEGPLMEPCLAEMLEYTLSRFREKTLPHFVLGHDLFEGRVFFQNEKQEEVFLEKFQILVDNLRSHKYLAMLAVNCEKSEKLNRIQAVIRDIGTLLKYHRQF